MADESEPLSEKGFLRMFRTDLVTWGGVKLAELIGVSPQHVSDVKHGNRGPSPAVLAYYGLKKHVETVRKVTYTKVK